MYGIERLPDPPRLLRQAVAAMCNPERAAGFPVVAALVPVRAIAKKNLPPVHLVFELDALQPFSAPWHRVVRSRRLLSMRWLGSSELMSLLVERGDITRPPDEALAQLEEIFDAVPPDRSWS